MTSPAGTGADASPPAGANRPATRIVTVRRRGPLRYGAASAGLGLVLVLFGAFLLTGQQVAQLATAKGRARVGNPVSFTAKDADYRVTFTADPLASDFAEDRANRLDCTVTDPDSSTRKLDANTSSVRITSRAGVTVAEFRGQAGATAVRCEWGGSSDLGGSYSVARTSKGVKLAGVISLVGGIVLLVGGILGVAVGFRGRMERQPIPA